MNDPITVKMIWTKDVFMKQQRARQKVTVGASLIHLKVDYFKTDGVYIFNMPYQCMQNLDTK